MATKEEIQESLTNLQDIWRAGLSSKIELDEVYPVQLNYLGGMEGGNCWGNQAQPVDPYEEEWIREQAMKLANQIREHLPKFHLPWDMFQSVSSYQSDYYGNEERWELQYIELKKLYRMFDGLQELLEGEGEE